MCHNDAIAEEFLDIIQCLLNWFSVVNLFLGDMGNIDRERGKFPIWIDEEINLIENLSGLIPLNSTKFNQSSITAGKSGCFGIEHDKGFLLQ